jgi:hypothetical protein
VTPRSPRSRISRSQLPRGQGPDGALQRADHDMSPAAASSYPSSPPAQLPPCRRHPDPGTAGALSGRCCTPSSTPNSHAAAAKIPPAGDAPNHGPRHRPRHNARDSGPRSGQQPPTRRQGPWRPPRAEVLPTSTSVIAGHDQRLPGDAQSRLCAHAAASMVAHGGPERTFCRAGGSCECPGPLAWLVAVPAGQLIARQGS